MQLVKACAELAPVEVVAMRGNNSKSKEANEKFLKQNLFMTYLN